MYDCDETKKMINKFNLNTTVGMPHVRKLKEEALHSGFNFIFSFKVALRFTKRFFNYLSCYPIFKLNM